jgi:hypothetical protein
MAIKFKKCILHIGTEKTGTTTLQAFLGINREALLEQGYFVPRSLSPHPPLANHERLTTFALREEKVNDDLRVAAGVKDAAQVVQHRAEVVAELKAEIASFDASDTTLLLTNEHCQSRLVEVDEVGTLRSMLSEFANNFQIVVYLRPQHELATSLYDQALKAGYFDIDIIPFTDPKTMLWISRNFFQYDDLTKRWSEVFGRQSMTVRLFQREHLRDKNIVSDFAQLVGISLSNLSQVRDQNQSVGRSFQQALNAINRFGAAHPGAISPETRTKLIDLFTKAAPEPSMKPTRRAAADFLKQFESGNEFVRQTFFPERLTLFDIDYSFFPEVAPQRPLDREVLSKAILHVVQSTL